LNINWKLTDDFFSLEFDEPVRALSSAVLNGGFCDIGSFINLRVDENSGGRKTDFPPPAKTIAAAADAAGLPDPVAGMMTAATMNSFQFAVQTFEDINVYCFLTSGLSNALAAGDPGEFKPQQMFSNSKHSRFGTINMAIGTDVPLSDGALAEALMVITEAKSSVLFDLAVKSRVSDRRATGTGTDSAMVFCTKDPAALHEKFCGKHTVLGQLFASAVRNALSESLKGDKLFI
jgi:adenosylcobinamide amidohydrolase